MASAEGTAPNAAVLTTDAVGWCIDQLTVRKVHTFFPAYLVLRKRAQEQGTDSVTPDLSLLAELLEVPGGPPNKPYFRPFWHGGGATEKRWLNKNIAGSYAGSSLRSRPLKVLGYEDGAFTFEGNHWERAKEYLLYGERIPAELVAGFFYRNYAFQTEAHLPVLDDLISVFRDDFGYGAPLDEPDAEFDALFEVSEPDFERVWFEPMAQKEAADG